MIRIYKIRINSRYANTANMRIIDKLLNYHRKPKNLFYGIIFS